MGWWNPHGTADAVGDLPLDVLGKAVLQVIKIYNDEFGRPPSVREWEILLGAALDRESERVFVETVDNITVNIGLTAQQEFTPK